MSCIRLDSCLAFAVLRLYIEYKRSPLTLSFTLRAMQSMFKFIPINLSCFAGATLYFISLLNKNAHYKYNVRNNKLKMFLIIAAVFTNKAAQVFRA